jgi:hypothetical protein
MIFCDPYNVILNLFQDPFLAASSGFWGAMDAETRSA